VKLVHVSAIATGIVLVLGAFMVIPIYLHSTSSQYFLLSFSVLDNVEQKWCDELSSTLQKHKVQAIIYFSGKAAEKNPDCVKSFQSNIDIGSQTYHYTALTTISDYSQQLEEITEGKKAVDKAGNLNSRLFKAPYGSTDANIYSLLQRSDIIADFSYDNQYNKYHNGQFINFDLDSYDGANNTPEFFKNLLTEKPVVINFDDSISIEYVNDLISKTKSRNTFFIDASQLTGLSLTIRDDGMA